MSIAKDFGIAEKKVVRGIKYVEDREEKEA